MKSIKYIVFAVIGSLVLTACEDIESLKRDNPLDEYTKGKKIVFYSFEIQPETIYMNGIYNRIYVSLKNNGSETAKNVTATFSSSYNVFKETKMYYGDIQKHEVKGASFGVGVYHDYYIELFAIGLPAGVHQIPISINIVDDSGNTWTDSFNIDCFAKLEYNSYKVYYNNNPNPGKTVHPGETVQIGVSLKNTGTSQAAYIKASFSTSSPYVSGFSPTGQMKYDNFSKNGEIVEIWAYDYERIKFTVLNTAPKGTQIPINISIVNNRGDEWTDSFNVPVE